MFSGLKVDTYGCSEIGKVRKVNEDHYLIVELHKVAEVKGTNLPLQHQGQLVSGARGLLLMVADGVAGSPGGEKAGAIALDTIVTYIVNSMRSFYKFDDQMTGDMFHELALSVQLSHEKVIRESKEEPGHRHMGTTLTKVHVLWPHAYVVQIGDSRCYLLRGEKIRQLTKDQTAAQYLIDTGTLDPGEAAGSRLSHVLTQAIGSRSADLDSAISRVDLKQGDSLLLCTDGLTGHLFDANIADLANRFSSAQDACEALLRAALDAGGSDNVTVILSRFG